MYMCVYGHMSIKAKEILFFLIGVFIFRYLVSFIFKPMTKNQNLHFEEKHQWKYALNLQVKGLTFCIAFFLNFILYF